MDLRNIHLPEIQRSKPKRSSEDFINRLNIHLKWIEHHKMKEEVVRIYYGGFFGVMRVLRISPEGDDFLSLVANDKSGTQHEIVAPVVQCSFMFSVIVPTSEEPAEQKVILGFSADHTA